MHSLTSLHAFSLFIDAIQLLSVNLFVAIDEREIGFWCHIGSSSVPKPKSNWQH